MASVEAELEALKVELLNIIKQGEQFGIKFCVNL